MTRNKAHILIAIAASLAALAAAWPAAGGEGRTAGAPHYLHFGRGGLCHSLTDWDSVDGGIELDETKRIVSVSGQSDAYDFLEITVQNQGTSTLWDDMLLITLTSYSIGPPDVDDLEVPLYEPGNGGGGNGDWTTENTPAALYLKRIEFSGSTTDPNGVTNDSRVPMYARGFFGSADGVEGFFLGGDGPDCVEAVTGKNANRDNVIETRGGADYIRTGFGNDSISTGDDNDTVEAGSGDDVLRGNGGVDLLKGAGGNDCYSGSQTDGLRDVLDDGDAQYGESNDYAAEPGTVDGIELETIEIITEENPFLVVDCVG